MSIYRSGVDAYRDTTKWLAALTPATTLVATVVALGGPLAGSFAASRDPWGWIARELGVLLCGVLVLICVGAILWMASRVLSVEPTEISRILKSEPESDEKTSVEKAIGDGVLGPDFYTEASFKDLVAAAFADSTSSAQGTSSVVDGRLERLRTAFETLREWKIFVTTRSRFRSFVVTVAVAVAVLTVTIGAALMQIDSSGTITRPIEVSVVMTPDGVGAAQLATQCLDVGDATFYALAGTWAHPVLSARGAGCEATTTWQPGPGDASVVPKS